MADYDDAGAALEGLVIKPGVGAQACPIPDRVLPFGTWRTVGKEGMTWRMFCRTGIPETVEV
jgi:hypothetical protein